ncbi:MAG: pilus assembly protein [Chloroflexi bacterium]|nr:pilus assembly protein [Chloroflexota bacterium]
MVRKVKSVDGAGTVEFALVGLLLFMLMQGVMEGGRVFGGWLVITNEAREAARWGAVRVGDPAYPSFSSLETAVRDQIISRTEGLISHDPAVFSVVSTANDTAVTVRIDYIVDMISPLMASIWPSFQLSAESVMRSE